MKIYKKIALFVNLLLITSVLGAQSISDLGVVWDKTYPVDGYARNMKTNRDGSGYVISGTGVLNGKPAGSIMVINESGELLKSVVTPVTVKDPTTGVPVYTPIDPNFGTNFNVAFKTDDGGIIAFGAVRDAKADPADKLPSAIGGYVDPADNPYLSYGSWIVKYDADLNVTKAIRVRGGEITQGWQLSNGNILVAGMDASTDPVLLNNITLLRIYDQQGNLVKDARSHFSVGLSLYQYPNSDNFLLATNGTVIKLSVIGNNVTVTSSKAIASLGLTQMIAPYIFNITPSNDGGVFLFSNLNSVLGDQNRLNGRGFYRLRSNYTEVYSFISKPVTQNFHSPFLLEGNTYVGNYGAGYTNSITGMYQLIDDGTFNTTIGQALPGGTAIKHVSASDGFFSIGGTNTSQKIAKLSTCVNFKTTSLTSVSTEFIKEYSPTINFSLPLNYAGNKGTVTYDLQVSVKNGQVNGKLEGDVLYTKTSQPPASSSIATTINDSWTLNTKYAVIEYRFTLHDAYQTAGVNQSCGQMYIFRLVILPQTDVVEMPTRINNGSKNVIKAGLKNIGEGSFDSYKITIYDSALGSSTKHTYTLSGLINPSETSRFELDLAGTSLATSSTLVVSFNDDGNGTLNQSEQATKQFTYVVN